MCNTFKVSWRNLSLLTIAACLIVVQAASAETDASAAKRSFAAVRTELKRLRKLVKKSGVRQSLTLSASRATELADSDQDGLPDILEDVGGSDSCKSDSDNDGISDGDESNSGTNPDNSGSGEVEVKSAITAITATTVTVAGYTFTATSSTFFRGGTSLADFSVGNTVEVKGKIVSGVLTLVRIKTDD